VFSWLCAVAAMREGDYEIPVGGIRGIVAGAARRHAANPGGECRARRHAADV